MRPPAAKASKHCSATEARKEVSWFLRDSFVPELLERLRSGDRSVLDDLTTALYDELRRIATRHLRGERDSHTLQTTALVHEAYLKLCKNQLGFADRVHFLAVA